MFDYRLRLMPVFFMTKSFISIIFFERKQWFIEKNSRVGEECLPLFFGLQNANRNG